MSLFQCDKCGCLENTALTGCYWSRNLLEKHPDVLASYRQVLGLDEKAEFGHYCSACNPVWFDEGGEYGVGPRPVGYENKHGEHMGVWHGRFERIFLPKMLFHTNEDGNLAHMETLDTEVDKYRLEAEEEIALLPQVHRTPHRLPRPSDTEGCKRYLQMTSALKAAPEHLQPKDEPTRRGAIMVLANQALAAQLEMEEMEEKRRQKALARAATDQFPAGAEDRLSRRHRRLKFGGAMGLAAMAGVAAMSGVGLGADSPRRREPDEPKPKTKEELEAERQRSAAKLAAAEEKRRRKAEKRRRDHGVSG
jgi:hypothetical protein